VAELGDIEEVFPPIRIVRADLDALVRRIVRAELDAFLHQTEHQDPDSPMLLIDKDRLATWRESLTEALQGRGR